MKTFILFFVFFTSSFLLYAQQREIAGRITDASGAPVENVLIQVKATDIFTYSNAEGSFRIMVPENYNTLVFSSPEYGTIEEEITASNRLDASFQGVYSENLFELSLAELMELEIVTASKTEERISDIPASIIILTRQDIEMYGFTSLEEIFAHISGLYYVNNESFLGATIGVRGYMTANPTNIVVLINGVPQQNDLHNSFSFHLCPIPAEAIDRIEVVRGPMSVIYGSNAFFGAINIITNEALENETSKTRITVSTGNYENKRVVFTSKGKAQEFEYALNFSYNYDSGIDEPIHKMTSNLTAKYQTWGLLDTLVTSKDYFTNDQKYINFFGKFKNIYIETGFAAAKYGQTFSSLFYLPAQCKSNFSKSAVGFVHDFSDKFSLDAKVTYSRYDLLMEDNYFSTDTNGFGYESDIYSFGQYWSEKVEAEMNFFYKASENLHISFTAYQSSILDVGDKTDAPYNNSPGLLNRSGGVVEGDKVNTTAFYSQVSYSFLNHFKLVAGGRLERMSPFDLVLYRSMYYPTNRKFEGSFQQDDFQFVPRLALIVDVSDNQVIKIMYGEALKQPAVWELRNNLTVGQSLRPEKIQTLELNYMATFANYLASNVSFYRNDIKEVVLRSIIFDGNNYASYFSNGAEIQAYGAEITLTAFLTKKMKVEVSASYQESKYQSLNMEEVTVEFSPNLLLYGKASYQITENISLALLGNFVDKMEAQWDNTPINPADPESLPKGRIYGKAVEAYYLMTTNLRWKNICFSDPGAKKGLYLNLKIDNIFDQEIHYPSTSVSAWADKGVMGLGRNFIFSIGFEF